MHTAQRLPRVSAHKKKDTKWQTNERKPFNFDTVFSTWFQKISAAICSAVFHFDHDLLPISNRCENFDTIPLWSPIITGRGYREITGPTLSTCNTLRRCSPRNDGHQKIGVLLSQSARRTVTIGSPYLVIISHFLTPLYRWLLLRKAEGARRCLMWLFLFF